MSTPDDRLDCIDMNLARAEEIFEENKLLKDLVAAKDQLLVAYRLGSHTRADQAIAKIEKIKKKLERLGK